jgi:hypothetical protein
MEKFMKPFTYMLLGVCLGLVGFFGYAAFTEPSSAQKAARNQWEYATIIGAFSFSPTKERTNKIAGIAEICYLQAAGCRLAEVKHEIDFTAYLQDRALPLNDTNDLRNRAGIRASEIAFQKALAQMGNEGWEIVGEPDLNFEFIDYDNYLRLDDKSVFFNRTNTKAVYFKRLKAQ